MYFETRFVMEGLQKRQKKRHNRERNDAENRAEKHGGGGFLLPLAENLREVQHHGGNGAAADDVKRCLQPRVYGKEGNQKKAQKRHSELL